MSDTTSTAVEDFVLESGEVISSDQIIDITVVGAGPAGLFTVFSAGVQEARCRVIDSMPQVGGQLTALYPEKVIYDVPGFPKVTAKDLVDRLYEQAQQFNPEIHLSETVVNVERLKHRILAVTTDRGNVHYSRSVVIAAGIGAFTPRLPDDEVFAGFGEEHGFYTAVRDKSKFKGREVVILGGGDSAVDWVLGLAEEARSLAVVHRRNEFRAMGHSVTKMRELAEEGKVNVITPYNFKSVDTDNNGHVTGVTVEDKGGAEMHLKCDRLLCLLGFKNDLGPIVEWDLRFEDSAIKVEADMQTNIPGVFAVGDIASYPQKIKLILTGFADASIAVQNCIPYIRPGKKASHVFTSVRGLPAGSK
ncbi:MAG: NAD(P)/FAD-dependent oxidoreductase [Nitrospirota bacterium]|nr:NAD(P)/FAD-dependent oxidoreductase [Nitrospirota bacterium]